MTGDISSRWRHRRELADGEGAQLLLAAVSRPGPVEFVVEWCLPAQCPLSAEDAAHAASSDRSDPG